MSREVLVPIKTDLAFLDRENVNVYNYLRAKAIETIVMYGIRYPAWGMLKNSYKTTRENEDIARGICRLYPEEIKYSDIVKNDSSLCLDLLDKNNDRSIYNLDNLSYFSTSTQSNRQVVIKTLDTLREKLTNTPQYRFEYKHSELLDNIFNGKGFSYLYLFYGTNYPIIETLMDIDPIYAYSRTLDLENKTAHNYLETAMKNYLERYGIDNEEYPEYQKKGSCKIFNPDVKTKRLLRCIYNEKF